MLTDNNVVIHTLFGWSFVNIPTKETMCLPLLFRTYVDYIMTQQIIYN